MKKILSRIGFLLCTLVTLGVNYYSVALPINGSTTKQVSDQFFTMITPAGFTFSIWGVIYFVLLVISGLILFGKFKITTKTLFLYALSCLANCLWIFAWGYSFLFIAQFLILLLLASLLLLYREIKKETTQTLYPIVQNGILLYIGWVFVATLVMSVVTFSYTIPFLGSYGLVLALVSLFLAGLVNVLMLFGEKTPTTSFVLLRALFGIYYGQSSFDIRIAVTLLGSIMSALLLRYFVRLFSKKKY